MEKIKLPQKCPSCDASLKIERMCCAQCKTKVEGEFPVPRLARLSMEDQQFLELFILVSGSLKRVCKKLRISYPTERKLLDKLTAVIESEIEKDEEYRKKIIEEYEMGEHSVEDAIKMLKNM